MASDDEDGDGYLMNSDDFSLDSVLAHLESCRTPDANTFAEFRLSPSVHLLCGSLAEDPRECGLAAGQGLLPWISRQTLGQHVFDGLAATQDFLGHPRRRGCQLGVTLEAALPGALPASKPSLGFVAYHWLHPLLPDPRQAPSAPYRHGSREQLHLALAALDFLTASPGSGAGAVATRSLRVEVEPDAQCISRLWLGAHFGARSVDALRGTPVMRLLTAGGMGVATLRRQLAEAGVASEPLRVAEALLCSAAACLAQGPGRAPFEKLAGEVSRRLLCDGPAPAAEVLAAVGPEELAAELFECAVHGLLAALGTGAEVDRQPVRHAAAEDGGQATSILTVLEVLSCAPVSFAHAPPAHLPVLPSIPSVPLLADVCPVAGASMALRALLVNSVSEWRWSTHVAVGAGREGAGAWRALECRLQEAVHAHAGAGAQGDWEEWSHIVKHAGLAREQQEAITTPPAAAAWQAMAGSTRLGAWRQCCLGRAARRASQVQPADVELPAIVHELLDAFRSCDEILALKIVCPPESGAAVRPSLQAQLALLEVPVLAAIWRLFFPVRLPRSTATESSLQRAGLSEFEDFVRPPRGACVRMTQSGWAAWQAAGGGRFSPQLLSPQPLPCRLPDPPEDPPSPPGLGAAAGRPADEQAKNTSNVRVRVRVLAARGLRRAAAGAGPRAKLQHATPSPFVVVRLCAAEHRTRTLGDTAEPVWHGGGVFDFAGMPADAELELEVLSAGTSRDEMLGSAAVRLDELQPCQWHPLRRRLKPGLGELDVEVRTDPPGGAPREEGGVCWAERATMEVPRASWMPDGADGGLRLDPSKLQGRRHWEDSLPRGTGLCDAVWLSASALQAELAAQPGVGAARICGHVATGMITQGRVGNCWLISAISALAEFPELIRKVFAPCERLPSWPEPHPEADGPYELALHDPRNRFEETIVRVNDLVPCFQHCGAWRPCFAGAAHPELWPLLLEKGIAKLLGGYDLLNGNRAPYAWAMLTGETDFMVFFPWERGEMPRRPGQGDPEPGEVFWGEGRFQDLEDHPTRYSFHRGLDNVHSSERVWERLRLMDIDDKVMVCTFRPLQRRGGDGAAGEESAGEGLLAGHAYSLLQVRQVGDSSRVHRLLQIRNPWGDAWEWTGRWSDSSTAWEDYPEVAKALGYEQQHRRADGLFWMPWEDFRSRVMDIVFSEASFTSCKGGQPPAAEEVCAARAAAGNLPTLLHTHAAAGGKDKGCPSKEPPPSQVAPRSRGSASSVHQPATLVTPTTPQPRDGSYDGQAPPANLASDAPEPSADSRGEADPDSLSKCITRALEPPGMPGMLREKWLAPAQQPLLTAPTEAMPSLPCEQGRAHPCLQPWPHGEPAATLATAVPTSGCGSDMSGSAASAGQRPQPYTAPADSLEVAGDTAGSTFRAAAAHSTGVHQPGAPSYGASAATGPVAVSDLGVAPPALHQNTSATAVGAAAVASPSLPPPPDMARLQLQTSLAPPLSPPPQPPPQLKAEMQGLPPPPAPQLPREVAVVQTPDVAPTQTSPPESPRQSPKQSPSLPAAPPLPRPRRRTSIRRGASATSRRASSVAGSGGKRRAAGGQPPSDGGDDGSSSMSGSLSSSVASASLASSSAAGGCSESRRPRSARSTRSARSSRSEVTYRGAADRGALAVAIKLRLSEKPCRAGLARAGRPADVLGAIEDALRLACGYGGCQVVCREAKPWSTADGGGWDVDLLLYEAQEAMGREETEKRLQERFLSPSDRPRREYLEEVLPSFRVVAFNSQNWRHEIVDETAFPETFRRSRGGRDESDAAGRRDAWSPLDAFPGDEPFGTRTNFSRCGAPLGSPSRSPPVLDGRFNAAFGSHGRDAPFGSDARQYGPPGYDGRDAPFGSDARQCGPPFGSDGRYDAPFSRDGRYDLGDRNGHYDAPFGQEGGRRGAPWDARMGRSMGGAPDLVGPGWVEEVLGKDAAVVDAHFDFADVAGYLAGGGSGSLARALAASLEDTLAVRAEQVQQVCCMRVAVSRQQRELDPVGSVGAVFTAYFQVRSRADSTILEMRALQRQVQRFLGVAARAGTRPGLFQMVRPLTGVSVCTSLYPNSLGVLGGPALVGGDASSRAYAHAVVVGAGLDGASKPARYSEAVRGFVAELAERLLLEPGAVHVRWAERDLSTMPPSAEVHFELRPTELGPTSERMRALQERLADLNHPEVALACASTGRLATVDSSSGAVMLANPGDPEYRFMLIMHSASIDGRCRVSLRSRDWRFVAVDGGSALGVREDIFTPSAEFVLHTGSDGSSRLEAAQSAQWLCCDPRSGLTELRAGGGAAQAWSFTLRSYPQVACLRAGTLVVDSTVRHVSGGLDAGFEERSLCCHVDVSDPNRNLTMNTLETCGSVLAQAVTQLAAERGLPPLRLRVTHVVPKGLPPGAEEQAVQVYAVSFQVFVEGRAELQQIQELLGALNHEDTADLGLALFEDFCLASFVRICASDADSPAAACCRELGGDGDDLQRGPALSAYVDVIDRSDRFQRSGGAHFASLLNDALHAAAGVGVAQLTILDARPLVRRHAAPWPGDRGLGLQPRYRVFFEVRLSAAAAPTQAQRVHEGICSLHSVAAARRWAELPFFEHYAVEACPEIQVPRDASGLLPDLRPGASSPRLCAHLDLLDQDQSNPFFLSNVNWGWSSRLADIFSEALEKSVGIPKGCVAVTCIRLRPGHRQLADRARWLHDWHRQFETGEAPTGDDNIDDDSRDTCVACCPRQPRHWPAGYTVEFEIHPRLSCDPVAFLEDMRYRLRALHSDAVRRSRSDVELFRRFWLDSGLQVDEAPGCPGARPLEQHLYPQGDQCLQDTKVIGATVINGTAPRERGYEQVVLSGHADIIGRPGRIAYAYEPSERDIGKWFVEAVCRHLRRKGCCAVTELRCSGDVVTDPTGVAELTDEDLDEMPGGIPRPGLLLQHAGARAGGVFGGLLFIVRGLRAKPGHGLALARRSLRSDQVGLGAVQLVDNLEAYRIDFEIRRLTGGGAEYRGLLLEVWSSLHELPHDGLQHSELKGLHFFKRFLLDRGAQVDLLQPHGHFDAALDPARVRATVRFHAAEDAARGSGDMRCLEDLFPKAMAAILGTWPCRVVVLECASMPGSQISAVHFEVLTQDHAPALVELELLKAKLTAMSSSVCSGSRWWVCAFGAHRPVSVEVRQDLEDTELLSRSVDAVQFDLRISGLSQASCSQAAKGRLVRDLAAGLGLDVARVHVVSFQSGGQVATVQVAGFSSWEEAKLFKVMLESERLRGKLLDQERTFAWSVPLDKAKTRKVGRCVQSEDFRLEGAASVMRLRYFPRAQAGSCARAELWAEGAQSEQDVELSVNGECSQLCGGGAVASWASADGRKSQGKVQGAEFACAPNGAPVVVRIVLLDSTGGPPAWGTHSVENAAVCTTLTMAGTLVPTLPPLPPATRRLPPPPVPPVPEARAVSPQPSSGGPAASPGREPSSVFGLLEAFVEGRAEPGQGTSQDGAETLGALSARLLQTAREESAESRELAGAAPSGDRLVKLFLVEAFLEVESLTSCLMGDTSLTAWAESAASSPKVVGTALDCIRYICRLLPGGSASDLPDGRVPKATLCDARLLRPLRSLRLWQALGSGGAKAGWTSARGHDFVVQCGGFDVLVLLLERLIRGLGDRGEEPIPKDLLVLLHGILATFCDVVREVFDEPTVRRMLQHPGQGPRPEGFWGDPASALVGHGATVLGLMAAHACGGRCSREVVPDYVALVVERAMQLICHGRFLPAAIAAEGSVLQTASEHLRDIERTRVQKRPAFKKALEKFSSTFLTD